MGWTRIKSNPRREVWRGVVDERAIYVKYYLPSGWLRSLRERLWTPAYDSEWRAGLYALRANIPAVAPLACSPRISRNGRTCAVLVTEALEPAQPLHEFWRQVQSDPLPQRRREDTTGLAECLGALIARAHQAGFAHTDMHAANVLVQTVGPRTYRCAFVDLHSARLGSPISDQEVLENLAQLNQWFRRHSSIADRVRFLRAYLRGRDDFETAYPYGRPLGLTFRELVSALADHAERHGRQVWEQRDRRAGRDGRYFARLKLADGWRGNAFVQTRHPNAGSIAAQQVLEPRWWLAEARGILLAVHSPAANVAKDSHSARIVRHALSHPAQPISVILKQPRARNRWRRLVQSLPPSRARRAWATGNALLNRDVPTARPLALLEQRRGLLIRDCILVTEIVEHARDLEQHLRREFARCNSREWLAHRRQLVAELARRLRQLEQRRIYHRDCKAGNLLIVEKPALAAIWIDLDGVRIRKRPLTTQEVLRPLARLHVSLLDVPGLSRTDRVRFLKAYYARFGVAEDAWKQAWHGAEVLARQKLVTLAARREWKRKHYGRV